MPGDTVESDGLTRSRYLPDPLADPRQADTCGHRFARAPDRLGEYLYGKSVQCLTCPLQGFCKKLILTF